MKPSWSPWEKYPEADPHRFESNVLEGNMLHLLGLVGDHPRAPRMSLGCIRITGYGRTATDGVDTQT